MRTHATSRIWETSLQNCQKTKESLGNLGIFLLLKPDFPHMKLNFLQWLSAFFNGFLLSSTAFWFSSTAFQFSSTAFHFPRNLRKSIYGEKYTKDHYLSFVFFTTCSPTCSPSIVIPATIPNSNIDEITLPPTFRSTASPICGLTRYPNSVDTSLHCGCSHLRLEKKDKSYVCPYFPYFLHLGNSGIFIC